MIECQYVIGYLPLQKRFGSMCPAAAAGRTDFNTKRGAMETYKISISRGKFNIRDRGNKDGYPVVMLHGWPESSYCWEGVGNDLAPEYRIIAPDLRGLGDSERTLDVQAYRKDELAKDIVEILQHLEIDDFFLVGHDWGGVVAQEVALLIPNQIKKMILMNTPVLANVKGRKEATQKIHSQGSVVWWYQYFLQMPVLPETMIKGNEHVWVPYFFARGLQAGIISREIVDEYVRCYSIPDTPATGAAYYRTIPEFEKRSDELEGTVFQMPTLYIYGNQDIVVIPEYLNHIETCFDSVEVAQLEAGHFVQDEKASETAQLMNQFLSK